VLQIVLQRYNFRIVSRFFFNSIFPAYNIIATLGVMVKLASKQLYFYPLRFSFTVEGKNDTNTNEAEDNEKHGRGRSATEGYMGLFLASVYGVIAAKLWDSLNLSAPNLAIELLFHTCVAQFDCVSIYWGKDWKLSEVKDKA